MKIISTLLDTDGKILFSLKDSHIFSRLKFLQLSKLRVFTLKGNTARPTQNTATVFAPIDRKLNFLSGHTKTLSVAYTIHPIAHKPKCILTFAREYISQAASMFNVSRQTL